MMTMHAAKGLEFPTVFIVGMEEGIFPGTRVIGEPEEMEEERRLCYVAITRAKQKLYLTCAKQRMLFGRTTANLKSRFVEEIPEEDLQIIEPRPVQRSGGFADAHRSVGYGSSGRSYPSSRPQPRRPGITPPIAVSPQKTPAFALGDKVKHRAFGIGKITKVSPMGGDALLEITFEGVGLKRLMQRAAGQFMTKVEE